jgi:hypothetical protein
LYVCMYVCIMCVQVCVWERGSSSASPYLICSGVEEAVTGKLLTTLSVTLTHLFHLPTCPEHQQRPRAHSFIRGSGVAHACPRVPDWCAAALNATARERLDAWWRCNDGAARDGPRAFMRVERVLSLARRGARVGGGEEAIGSVQLGSWLALALSPRVMFSGVWRAEPHRGCVTLSVGHVGAARCLLLSRSPATICPAGAE